MGSVMRIGRGGLRRWCWARCEAGVLIVLISAATTATKRGRKPADQKRAATGNKHRRARRRPLKIRIRRGNDLIGLYMLGGVRRRLCGIYRGYLRQRDAAFRCGSRRCRFKILLNAGRGSFLLIMQRYPRETVTAINLRLTVIIDDAHPVRCLPSARIDQGILRPFAHADIDLLTVNDIPAPLATVFFYRQFDCHSALLETW